MNTVYHKVNADLITTLLTYKYGSQLPVCISNLYSRVAWVKPMKTKSANNTYAKFIAMLHDEKYGERNFTVPNFIQTDLGTEFQQIRWFNRSDGSTSSKKNDGRSFPLRMNI